ncbi:MAG: class I SAM-dependent methyltransferase [Cognatishimia sp.]
MNTLTRYEHAAPTWSKKARRLGYTDAYIGFLKRSAITSGPVLDVGTGSGDFALSWVAAGGSTDLTLLDPSAAMLNHAAAQFAEAGYAPTLLKCGLDDLSCDAQYDAILASHVIEHFADPFEAMRGLALRLKPGGQLFMVVSKPHWCNWAIWLRFRHRWYSAETVCHFAERAGLDLIRTHAFRSGPPKRTSLGYIFQKPQH